MEQLTVQEFDNLRLSHHLSNKNTRNIIAKGPVCEI